MTITIFEYIINCVKALPAVLLCMYGTREIFQINRESWIKRLNHGWFVSLLICCAAAIVIGAVASVISNSIYDRQLHPAVMLLYSQYVIFCIALLHYFPGKPRGRFGLSTANKWIVSVVSLLMVVSLGFYSDNMDDDTNMAFMSLNLLLFGAIECIIYYRIWQDDVFAKAQNDRVIQFIVLFIASAAVFYYFHWLADGHI
ncbi:MAG: hypothetical protein NC338_07390 [Firmicutes bacterium]|nr:hypothetical protein [Bacillota bacterium]MCM1400978.1 hypothetical protein [Bacteroides sp.]MCM1476501.1 hypothetical protein [Bacteroides sp.]